MIELNQKISLQNIDNNFLYHYRDSSENDIVDKFIDMEGNEVDITSIFPAANEEDQSKLFKTIKSRLDPIRELTEYLKKYVYLTNEGEYVLLATIIIHSYCVDLFSRTPYLWINGTKGSGKTTLMMIMKSLVYNPLLFSDSTASSLFRIIDSLKPTLFLDEVEALEKRKSSNQQIFQILNSGYQKDGTVSRTKGDKVIQFKTYGLKIIAGINPLFSTLYDRCIPLLITQPPPAYKMEVFRGEKSEESEKISSHIRPSIVQHKDELLGYINNSSILKIDEQIRLREYDKWFPILAIAKLFSTSKANYFQTIQDLALSEINKKSVSEQLKPENACREIIKDFLIDKSSRSKISDPNYYYFKTDEIQKVIQANDLHNNYRDKAEITLILKQIGIETDRRRFGQGPISLYKIPKSLNKE